MSEKNSENKDDLSSPAWITDNGPVAINVILRDAIDHIDRLWNEVMGISTGFTDLDEMTQGLHAGELIVVASRPCLGKSIFVKNLVERALQNSEKAVVVYSPEMPANAFVFRMLSSIGSIDLFKLSYAQMGDDDWPKLTSAFEMLMNRKLSIDEDTGISLEKIRSRSRQFVQEHGDIGLIVVDSLQMIQLDSNDRGCRADEVAEIVRGLKALARELKCPVVVTSHVDNNLEKRHNKRPMCFDLSDSSAIEQGADVILFVYRDEVYNPRTKDKGIAEIIIGKQRLGKAGRVRLAFKGKFARFENLPSEPI